MLHKDRGSLYGQERTTEESAEPKVEKGAAKSSEKGAKKKADKADKGAEQSTEKSGLVAAAEAVGAAAGKVAAMVGVTAERPNTPPTPKIGKLKPKNKSRLPRRQKKALQKAKAAASAPKAKTQF